MEGVYEQRKKVPPKKKRCFALEDISSPRTTESATFSLRKTISCPDLRFDVFPTNIPEYDDVIYSEGIRQMMAKQFNSNRANDLSKIDIDFENLIEIDEKDEEDFEEFPMSLNILLRNSTHINPVFLEWDSPMIEDTNRVTKQKFMKRVRLHLCWAFFNEFYRFQVIPYPEPQPPRQIHGVDFLFDFIPLEIRQAAMGNTMVTFCYYDPALLIYPGIQCVNAEHDRMFSLCPKVPHRFGKPRKMPPDEAPFMKHGEEIVDYLCSRSAVNSTENFVDVFTETEETRLWRFVSKRSGQKVLTPILEQYSELLLFKITF